MSGRLVRAFALALAMVVVAGSCAGVAAPSAGVTGAPSASSTAASIAPGATDCRSLYLSIDSLDPTLKNLRSESRDVIVGTVASEGGAFWESPTGKGPAPGEQLGEGNEFYILTPYVVTVDQMVTGSRSPGEITVVVEGGKIGCSKLEVSPAVTLKVKERYVLFLSPRLAATGARAIDLPLAFHAFPVTADGTVQTPLDGTISLAALSRALAQDPQSPTP
ncbi:MAG: hypothetical protein ACYC65_08955 [Candidatus Limnocylindrales bacterium]